MNVAHSQRKVAAELRIQVSEELTLTATESEVDPERIWVAVYGRSPMGIGVVSFSITQDDLRELCRELLTFAAEVKVEEPAF